MLFDGQSLSLLFFEYYFSTLFDSDLPRVVVRVPIDYVNCSFKSILREVGNRHALDNLTD